MATAGLKTVMKGVASAGTAVRALAGGPPGSAMSPQHAANAGIVHGQVLNCHKATHDYITKIVSQVSGMKALLLDAETSNVVGLAYSQSDLITKEVFLVESLNIIADAMLEERDEEEQLKSKLRKGRIMQSANVGLNEVNMHHLRAVVFMQPSSVSLAKLGVLLASPRYREYHIFFSNIVPSGFLEALADLDTGDKIQQVHEYYADYLAVTPSLFHFNADQTTASAALQVNNVYSSKASWLYDRDFQGLLSVLLSLKKRPDIRYMAGSDSCKKLALDLVHTMKDEKDLFTFQGEPTLLLLLDRKDDVVTPMLTQWTYQSMVHELVGINLNKVDLGKAEAAAAAAAGELTERAVGPKTEKEKEMDALRHVILAPESDDFFRSSMFVNFGELGIRIKKLVGDFKALTKTQSKLDTIADMQKFVDNYPQFKHQSATVTKHVAVMEQISKVVNKRRLLAVSAIEQELVCGPASEHAEAYEKLVKLVEDREVQFLDKLRCTILYALRYENHPSSCLPQLRAHLRAHAMMANYSDSVLEVVDKMLALSGGHTRTWPLFPQDTDELSLKSVVKSIQTGVKGIDNIHMQHRSLMHGVLQSLFAGELKTMHFPFAESGNVRTIYRRVIVYVVGGCTYEEYASVEALMSHPRYRGNFTAIVGGSAIHNSESFLREIVDIEAYRVDPNAEAPVRMPPPQRNYRTQGGRPNAGAPSNYEPVPASSASAPGPPRRSNQPPPQHQYSQQQYPQQQYSQPQYPQQQYSQPPQQYQQQYAPSHSSASSMPEARINIEDRDYRPRGPPGPPRTSGGGQPQRPNNPNSRPQGQPQSGRMPHGGRAPPRTSGGSLGLGD